ncbi:phage baseplate assembly protein V [Halodesulfovibrio aestuarii]|uniref:Phage baseplate assembly protein V n=1 Tax=Halodesulfovibrio aestuarii TaxID=126333 RepID=A0ABV4JTX3_9BACT
MSQHLSELYRFLAGLIRFGTVVEADYSIARVRVDCGGVVSNWLPWIAERAGNDRSWHALEVGEQVAVLSPGGETAQGIVLGSIYQAAHPAPANSVDVRRYEFKDGAVIEYDRAKHKLYADIPGDAEIVAAKSITANAGTTVDAEAKERITLKAPLLEFEGGLIRLIGPIESGGRGGETHPMKINGPMEHTGGNYVNPDNDVVANGISLSGHHHVCPTCGETGAPK